MAYTKFDHCLLQISIQGNVQKVLYDMLAVLFPYIHTIYKYSSLVRKQNDAKVYILKNFLYCYLTWLFLLSKDGIYLLLDVL